MDGHMNVKIVIGLRIKIEVIWTSIVINNKNNSYCNM
jgi:hypothetical protein